MILTDKKTNWTTEQEKAIDKVKGNLLIAASAGSGKTAVIVESIMQKIRQGHSIDRILLITFTNAAAGEMKERLTQALIEECRKVTGERRAKLIDERDKIGFADIGTIDSFCYKLVKTYSDRLGLSPTASIMSDEENVAFKSRVLDKYIDDKLAAEDPSFTAIYDTYYQNRSSKELKEKISFIQEKISDRADRQRFINFITNEKNRYFYGSEYESYCLNYLSGIIDENKIITTCREFLFLFTQDDDKKFIEYANFILTVAQKFSSLNTAYEKADYLKCVEFPRLPQSKTEIQKEFKSFKEFAENAVEKYRTLASQIQDGVNYVSPAFDQLKALLQTVTEYDNVLKEEKIKEDKLSYSDVENYTVRLLKEEDIRTEIKNSYDYVFFDEYQDVNETQDYIISAVSENNLITVGDVKQGIFSFRGARTRIYSDRYDHYELTDEGENIHFNENFRSAKGILDFVNEFFSPVMTKDFGGADYAQKAKLILGNDKIQTEDDCVCLKMYSFPAGEKISLPAYYSVKDAALIEKEEDELKAKMLYDELQRYIGKEVIIKEETVKDGKPFTALNKIKISYKDIAILVRNKSSLSSISCLENYGVKLDLSQMGTKLNYPENGFLLAIFKLLENDMQDYPLAQVMLSPLGGFSENELAFIYNATRKNKFKYFFERVKAFSTQFPENDLSLKINKLFCSLKKYRLYACENNAGAVAEKILTDCNYRAYLSIEENAKERLNALSALVKEAENYPSVSDFISFFDNLQTDKTFNRPPAAGEAVTVCSIHKAKGLQYPVVIYYDFDRPFNLSDKNKGKNFLYDADWGFAAPYYPPDKKTFKETALQTAFSLKIQRAQLEEELRLVYVALTRAKYYLTIVAKKPKEYKSSLYNVNSPFGWLCYAKDRSDLVRRVFEKGESTVSVLQKTIQKEEQKNDNLQIILQDNDVVDKIQNAVRFNYPYKDSTLLHSKYSVTELIKLNEPEQDVKYLYSDPNERQSGYLEQDYVQKGIALHAAMQYIPLDVKEEDLLKELDALVNENILSREILQKISPENVWKCLNSETIKNSKNAKVLREQPFLLCLPAQCVIKNTTCKETIVLQGVIDYLSLGQETVLVDYKASKKTKEQLKNTYSPQLDLYAMAVEKITGRKVDKKVIYNFYTGEEIVL